MKAVGTDARLRCFFADDSRSRGLLIGCKDAAPQLEEPLGERGRKQAVKASSSAPLSFPRCCGDTHRNTDPHAPPSRPPAALIEAAADSDGEAMLRATLLPRAGQEMPAGVDADAVVAMQQQAKVGLGQAGLLPPASTAYSLTQQRCPCLSPGPGRPAGHGAATRAGPSCHWRLQTSSAAAATCSRCCCRRTWRRRLCRSRPTPHPASRPRWPAWRPRRPRRRRLPLPPLGWRRPRQQTTAPPRPLGMASCGLSLHRWVCRCGAALNALACAPALGVAAAACRA